MRTYKDQLNRQVFINDHPIRIVSLVPSITELLVDLGLEKHLVGITKFCVHPSDLRKRKVVVGGTKSVKLDKIKALNPDLILCNKEENSQEIVHAVEEIAPVHISDINTLEDCYELIKMYGVIFKVNEKADIIIDTIEKARKSHTFKYNSSKSVTYFIWKKPYMVVGSNTFINTMLIEAGFHNVFEDEVRYPEIDLDHPKLKLAETIFLSSEPYPFKDNHILEIKESYPNKEVKIVDGEYFSWYGSRLIKAFKYFKTLHQ